jgi:hypothetical protein
MDIKSVAASLAERLGATARKNVIEIPGAPRPTPKAPKPAPARRIGLSRNGLDFAWTRQRDADLTPEGVYLKRESEHLRHALKKFYKGETA